MHNHSAPVRRRGSYLFDGDRAAVEFYDPLHNRQPETCSPVAGGPGRIESGEATEYLTVQRYRPDVQSRSFDHLAGFSAEPWPTWHYRLPDGTEIEHELFIPKERSMVDLRWRLVRPAAGKRLVVRPL